MPRWNEEAGEGRTTELLEGNHGIVKLLILIHGHLLLLHSAQTCVTPIELIHTPKRVDGQEEAVHWVPLKVHLQFQSLEYEGCTHEGR